jgi:hypothetical protein
MLCTPKMTLPSQPPSSPLQIPMTIVTMMPPRSSPGISSLAIAPASNPIMTQAMIPVTDVPGVR